MTMMALRPEQVPTPDFKLTMTDDPTSEMWQAGEALEAEVFIGKEYVASAEELAGEYQAYVHVSKFAVVEDSENAVGASRIILPNSTVGLKTLNDIASGRLDSFPGMQSVIDRINPVRTLEIGTIGVVEAARQKPKVVGRVAMGLYTMIFQEALDQRATTAVASFDQDYLERFRMNFPNAITDIGPATDYMGSLTVPVVMNLMKMYHEVSKREGTSETISSFANSIVQE